VNTFGCSACYGDDPQTVRDHLRTSAGGPPIVDDSHFIVRIVRCRACSQGFIYIFTEFIDWEDGNDPQYVTLMPVTGVEAAAFTDGTLPVQEAGALGKDRRHLVDDWPASGGRRLRWATGTFDVSEGG
jgi:hypothetical protein